MASSVSVRSTRKLHRFVLVLLLCLACAASAAAQEMPDWSGEWDTRWRDGGARLILSQDGSTVTGVYPLYNGRVEAQSVGRELRGSWRSDNGAGDFVFVQSREGDSFTGRYASGEWWTGARAVERDTDDVQLAQWGPAETVGSFLRTMNAVGPGSTDLLGTAAALLVPADEAETGINRIDHARLLFEVIDQLTVRLWDLPQADEMGAVTARVGQAGTGVMFDLDLLRIGVRWYIAPPPADLLRAMRDRLTEARAARLGEIEPPEPALASPRETMRTFLVGMFTDPGNPSEAVVSTLDLSEISYAARAREAPVLARFLKQTLDRVGYIIWQELPDNHVAEAAYLHFQHPLGEIAIAPVATPDGTVWQFTPDTLRNIRTLYAAMDEMPLAPGLDALPAADAFFQTRKAVRKTAPFLLQRLGVMELWQWSGLLASVLMGGLVGLTLGGVARRFDQPAPEAPARTSARVQGLAIMWLALAVGAAVLLADVVLAVPDEVGSVTTAVAWLLLILAGAIVAGRVIDWAAAQAARAEDVDQHQQTIIDLVRRVARIVAYLIAAILAAQVLHIPWQGLVAGISIGGLAVALAVQPALGNLFSGITLYSDRPIKVGDFCRFGGTMGTVEHIGLRSTRIRTLDRTLVTIPNAEFANMQIENYAQRDRIWLATTLQLRYETTEDQLRYVLVELRKLLIAHPCISAEPARVRFAGFGAHSLDIEIFTYVLTSDIDEFHAVREDVFLRMMAVVDAAGAQFAFPSAVHYRAEDTAPDPARVQAAEAEVERWRSEDALPFPDFDWREKASLSSTLDYPPAGSALGSRAG